MPRSVAVVFDRDYSGALEKLAFTTPVWLVETPENRAAAEAAWHAAVEWPHITVTMFRAPANEPSLEEWKALVEQISVREGAVDVVEAIGTPLLETAREVLVDAGFGRFDETATGFRARR